MELGLPYYASDLAANFEAVLRQSELTERQAWGTAVASAIAARSPSLRAAIEKEAASHLDGPSLTAARTAAAMMAMSNVFYRFRHLTANRKYDDMPSRLPMQSA